MTDETRARFLAAIAKQIPADKVMEIHLFAGIRQGGTESGVAVVAVERAPAPSLDVDGGFTPPTAMAEAAEVETPSEVVVHDQLTDETSFVADETLEDTSPYADVVLRPDIAVFEEAEYMPPPPASRYIVYSARYRLTLKGLDRGKWEVTVKEEADAPLLTIDAVVRGVQRRSGDVDETVRLSGDEFRAALPTPVAT
ncbi:MAG: hypothetical protein ABIT20_19490 [Gemmatimonadaceae bacterium]